LTRRGVPRYGFEMFRMPRVVCAALIGTLGCGSDDAGAGSGSSSSTSTQGTTDTTGPEGPGTDAPGSTEATGATASNPETSGAAGSESGFSEGSSTTDEMPTGCTLPPATTVSFATVGEGQAFLTTQDDYLDALSPYDRSLNTGTVGDAPLADVLQSLSDSVRAWEQADADRLLEICNRVADKMQGYAIPLPSEVLLVSTEGGIELPYTRGNGVVFPRSILEQQPDFMMERIFIHEVFHLMTRHDPALRDELYEIIGFYPVPELAFPSELAELRVTNPDSPILAHAIDIQLDAGGPPTPMIPITYATEPYAEDHGGNPLGHAALRLVGVDTAGGQSIPLEGPLLVDPYSAPGFFESIGMNTMYIIHPEETLADNFVFLMLDQTGLPNPEIIEELDQRLP
jgi:hypothetical protein